MKLEKYLIKKDKLDLLSSLEALDKKLLQEKMEEFEVNNIEELKNEIIDQFTFCLETSIDDVFAQMYSTFSIHSVSKLMTILASRTCL